MRFVDELINTDYLSIGCSVFNDHVVELFPDAGGRGQNKYLKPLKYFKKEQAVFNGNKRAGYKSTRVVDKALEITCNYFNLVCN